MDLENLNGEQPEVTNSYSADVQNEDNNSNENLEVKSGSPYGKFKDAKSLLDAYNSLEAEFTRKSQKLSEVLKGNLSQEKSALPTENSANENRKTPQYKLNNWKEKVSEFYLNNAKAKEESKNIAKILIKYPEIAESENCLDIAYKMAISEKYVEPASLSCDEDFLKKYIADNERAKEMIIGSYIKSLNSRQSAPDIILGRSTDIAKTPAKKLNSIDEAGEILRKYFN